MMTHLEGPIVDSFYDMSLCSWNKHLEPPLPSHDSPVALSWRPNFPASVDDYSTANRLSSNNDEISSQATGSFTGNSEKLNHLDLANSLEHQDSFSEHSGNDPHYDPDINAELFRAQSVLEPKVSENSVNAVTRHLSMLTHFFGVSRVYSEKIQPFNLIQKAMHQILISRIK